MGTNYYFKQKENLTGEGIHIGKSSSGWCFSLHVVPEQGINALEDWKRYFTIEGSVIVDEYSRELTVSEMLNVIENRSSEQALNEDWFNELKSKPWGAPYTSFHDYLDKNYAELGPNNLLRHKIDGTSCVGYGEGTWDYIDGVFS